MRHHRSGPVGNFFAGLIIGPIFLIVGFFVAFYFGKPIVDNARASLNWPTVEGRITVSKVERKRDRDSVNYSANVGYNYEVDGEKLLGNTVWFGGNFSSSSSGLARKTVEKYPTGTAVQVYYNPENPDQSVLEPGTFWSTYLIYGVGLLFLGIGLLVTGSMVWKILLGTAIVGGAIGSQLISGQADEMKDFSSQPPDSARPPFSPPSANNQGDDGFHIE